MPFKKPEFILYFCRAILFYQGEQIAELSGLIHMNARVYDSDIGRFLSADTIIQAPHDSQSYNRYSYVRNNPLVYTDPSGHSWVSKLWKKVKKHLRTIISIIVTAVIAIYAPQLLVQLFSSGSWGGVTFSALGTTTAMGTTLSGLGMAAVGAVAGFASGAIMTGSLSGALKGAMWGAIGAGVAFGIGEGLGHAGGILSKGVSSGQAFIKAAAHGLSRGIISMAQGGTFKSGFASGFSSSFFSPGTTGKGGFFGRTSIAAIVGGTASKLGGGKFSNGAVSGAFVHMFNAEARAYLKSVSVSIDKNIKKILSIKEKYGGAVAKAYFFDKVRPHGDWDYKRIYGLDVAEDLGNFNYGATGRAAGFNMNTLLRAGGFVSEIFGTYEQQYGHFYGNYPYGDNGNDQQMIIQGYYYAK